MSRSKNLLIKIKKVIKILGPGLVTGASDDDPSGIAIYSQAAPGLGLLHYGQSRLLFR